MNWNAPGRIDCNTVKGDTSPEVGTSLGDTLVVQGISSQPMEVVVQFSVRPGPGTNVTNFNAWLTRHHFEENKDGLPWYSARMDTAEVAFSGPISGTWMTAYHESDPNFTGADRDPDPNDHDPNGAISRLKNDIFPDNLLTPGSRLNLFYKARYTGASTWFLLPDTTGGTYYEMEVLPSSMEADRSHNAILYVDHFDRRGNEKHMHAALSEAVPGGSANFENTAWDRWDVRAPTSQKASFGRPLRTEYGANIVHALAYDIIVWDSGNLSTFCLTREDGDVLKPWLTIDSAYNLNGNGFYLAGDGLVESAILEGATEPSAQSLLQDLAGVDLRCTSFRSADCPAGTPADPVSCVVLDDLPRARTITDPREADHLGQGNGCPELRRFDVLSVNPDVQYGDVAPEERYEGSVKTAAFASISNSASSGSILYATVVDGISLHHRRDPEACVPVTPAPPRALVERLTEVVTWLDLSDRPTTGVAEDPPPPRMSLAPPAQNPLLRGSRARLAFTLPKAGPARVAVYSLAGALVKEVFRGPAQEGANEAVWDLRDSQGRPAAAGVYLYRLEADGMSLARKLVVTSGP